MIHHLREYPPNGRQRPGRTYRAATTDRAGVGGIGLEWLVPIALALGLTLGVLTWLGTPPLAQAIFSAISIGWGLLMFSYMHDSMHVLPFWMERAHPVLRSWYRRARRRHDIHHMFLHESGRMHRNYGICFFWFDRLFGTYAARASRTAPATVAAAMARYHAVIYAPAEARNSESLSP
jgi:sterol desaturase/sphingolipid hydroxylase (fatty acid hydroxylase superfamily)